MRFVRRNHEQKVKALRFEPYDFKDGAPELKISWTDEEGLRHTAWVKCSTLRTIKIVDEKAK